MKSVASAPGKVILFGEHFVVYGVKAILCSINKRATVTSTTTQEKSVSIRSKLGNISIPIPKLHIETDSPLNPFIYIAKKMINEFDSTSGIEVVIDSEIPPGIGLGSSSACCVAAAASISALFKKYSPEEIRKMAIDAEKTIFKATSGADCTVCTYGGIIEYNKKVGFKQITKSDFRLVIANSMTAHSTDMVVAKVKEFKKDNEQIFSSLCNDESKLIEKVNLALRNHNLKELGKYMSQNQNYLEKLGVSNDNLRSMIRTAQETSFGAKITGAGGGGCIIALVDDSNLEQTVNNLRNKSDECFAVKTDKNGYITATN